MNFSFNYYKQLDDVEFYLCNPDGRELFPLNAYDRNVKLRFNDLSTLEFNVPSKLTKSDGMVIDAEYYDYVETVRLVYATKIGWFKIVDVSENVSGDQKYKSVQAESLQCVFKNRGFVVEERPYKFYDPDDPLDTLYRSEDLSSSPSVVGQMCKQLGFKISLHSSPTEPEAPLDDWTITYIDKELYSNIESPMYRNFTENITYGYDWMVNDVEEAFGVVFVFDFMNKAVWIRVVSNITKRSNLCLSFSNFMKSIDITEGSDDIITVLSCKGDGVDITNVNPTGTNYIVDFSYYMDVGGRWMSKDLIDLLRDWSEDTGEDSANYKNYRDNIDVLSSLYAQETALKTRREDLELSIMSLNALESELTAKMSDSKNTETDDAYKNAFGGIFVAETVDINCHSLSENSQFYNEKLTDNTGLDVVYTLPPDIYDEFGIWSYSDGLRKRLEEDDGVLTKVVISELFTTEPTKYYFFDKLTDGEQQSSYCELNSEVRNARVPYIFTGTPVPPYKIGDFYSQNTTMYICIADRGEGEFDSADWRQATTQEVENKEKTIRTYGCAGFTRYSGLARKALVDADLDDSKYYIQSLVPAWKEQQNKAYNAINNYIKEHTREYSISEDDFNRYILDYLPEGSERYESGIAKEIANTQTLLDQITSKCNLLSYVANNGSSALLKELNSYWIEGEYTNEHITAYDTTTPEEALQLAIELKKSGQTELSKICQPRYSFSLSASNFLKQYEFKDQAEELILGQVITVEKEDGVWFTPALLEMSFSLDDADGDLSMSFANKLRLDDWGYTYADIMSDAASTSRQVSANWQNITSYANNKDRITDLLMNPLDATLRAANANMVNQDFIIDKTGILGRKYVSSTSDEFEKEQMRISNNVILFTDDEWETTKTALGKVYWEDESGELKTSYGLIAETIIGRLMMSEQTKIVNSNSTISLDHNGITIKNQDGNIVFSATTDGKLTITGSTKTFTEQPTPPYSVGDLWSDGTAMKICTTDRADGSFNDSDWKVASTDDSGIYTKDATTIDGGKITTGSINADKITAGTITSTQMNTDAIQSKGYTAGQNGSVYSSVGTFLNLADGSIHAPNFAIDNGGQVYVKGHIEAMSGSMANWDMMLEEKNSSGGVIATNVLRSPSYDYEYGGDTLTLHTRFTPEYLYTGGANNPLEFGVGWRNLIDYAEWVKDHRWSVNSMLTTYSDALSEKIKMPDGAELEFDNGLLTGGEAKLEIQCGHASTSKGIAEEDVYVEFNQEFSGVPYVFITPISSAGSVRASVALRKGDKDSGEESQKKYNTTTTESFTAHITRSDKANTYFSWVAIYSPNFAEVFNNDGETT